jgi:exonuclease III
MDYFLTTTDQLEGVKHLGVNRDEKYLGYKDVHSDHRPLVLIIT